MKRTKRFFLNGVILGCTTVFLRGVGVSFNVYITNKIGAEGQLSHSENGVSRQYESSWISEQLLSEVVPIVGVPK